MYHCNTVLYTFTAKCRKISSNLTKSNEKALMFVWKYVTYCIYEKEYYNRLHTEENIKWLYTPHPSHLVNDSSIVYIKKIKNKKNWLFFFFLIHLIKFSFPKLTSRLFFLTQIPTNWQTIPIDNRNKKVQSCQSSWGPFSSF